MMVVIRPNLAGLRHGRALGMISGHPFSYSYEETGLKRSR
jgi:hypothetical protein